MSTENVDTRHSEPPEISAISPTAGIFPLDSDSRAFTLVELVVVIAIIGILSVLGLMGYSGYSESARDAVRLSHMGTISQTLEEYAKKNAHYPSPDNATSIAWS